MSDWPVEEGRYWVGNKRSPIAVNTLGDVELPELLRPHLEPFVAICGKNVTENIGIEKVIRNIITNPNIRVLVLCGPESKGHFVGQAFKALKENGIDDSGRIIGAVGPIPFLKNMSKEEVEQFRNQVEIVDLINETDIEKIVGVVRELYEKYGEGDENISFEQNVEVIEAEGYEITLDPKGYFVIELDREKGKIVVSHYDNSHRLLRKIVGDSAEKIYKTIIKNQWISLMDHAAYLGKELGKAEMALRHNLEYEQEGG